MNPIIWHWTPLKSVNDIKFDGLADPIIQKYNLDFEDKLFEDVVAYTNEDASFMLAVNNNLIESINIFSNLYYKDKNIIGLSRHQVIDIFGNDYEIDHLNYNDGERDVYKTSMEYEHWGIVLWLENDAVVSVQCYGESYYDE